MAKVDQRWLVSERRNFVAELAETGSTAAAAGKVGRSLAAAYRERERVPEFAEAWQRAIAVAWELVETRVLAGLLTTLAGADAGKLIEGRMGVAIMQRRERTPVAKVPAPVDERRVTALRAEIGRLAALR